MADMKDAEDAPPDESGDKRADRDEQGRLLPGHSVGVETRWGTPEHPPPKSPGRPKKEGWLRELKKLLDKDERLAEAMAARLAKIALKGRDGDALKALAMIQDRVGGPVALRIDGLSEEELYVRLMHLLGLLVRRLPSEYHVVIAEVAKETLNDDKPPWLLEAMEES